MLRVVGNVIIPIIGDGQTKQASFSISQMLTPSPMVQGLRPTGIGQVSTVGGIGGNVTAKLEGGMVTITFDTPPLAAKVSIDFLYGPAQ